MGKTKDHKHKERDYEMGTLLRIFVSHYVVLLLNIPSLLHPDLRPFFGKDGILDLFISFESPLVTIYLTLFATISGFLVYLYFSSRLDVLFRRIDDRNRSLQDYSYFARVRLWWMALIIHAPAFVFTFAFWGLFTDTELMTSAGIILTLIGFGIFALLLAFCVAFAKDTSVRDLRTFY